MGLVGMKFRIKIVIYIYIYKKKNCKCNTVHDEFGGDYVNDMENLKEILK